RLVLLYRSIMRPHWCLTLTLTGWTAAGKPSVEKSTSYKADMPARSAAADCSASFILTVPFFPSLSRFPCSQDYLLFGSDLGRIPPRLFLAYQLSDEVRTGLGSDRIVMVLVQGEGWDTLLLEVFGPLAAAQYHEIGAQGATDHAGELDARRDLFVGPFE